MKSSRPLALRLPNCASLSKPRLLRNLRPSLVSCAPSGVKNAADWKPNLTKILRPRLVNCAPSWKSCECMQSRQRLTSLQFQLRISKMLPDAVDARAIDHALRDVPVDARLAALTYSIVAGNP